MHSRTNNIQDTMYPVTPMVLSVGNRIILA